ISGFSSNYAIQWRGLRERGEGHTYHCHIELFHYKSTTSLAVVQGVTCSLRLVPLAKPVSQAAYTATQCFMTLQKQTKHSIVDLAGDDVESSDDKECMLVAGVAEVARPKRLPPEVDGQKGGVMSRLRHFK
ncbi:Protein of unknown function, partial [Gryllus bimaculatus]